VRVAHDQSLPHLWLLSDARNDTGLEDGLKALPRRSGFVFRHYHLAEADRFDRFQIVNDVARSCDHLVILSAPQALAKKWGADGVYGSADEFAASDGLMCIATAHNGYEIEAANAAGADAIMLSPVFSTRSHPGAPVLGPFGFSVLAQQADRPVIALGGMTKDRATEFGIRRWAAIDGLS